MKKSFLITILLFSAVSVFCQEKKKKFQPSPDPSAIMVIPKNLFNPKKNEQLSGDRKALIDKLTLLRQSKMGSYSHTTPYGKVYNMRPSNMPCLVPDVSLNAKMPGTTPSPLPPSNMPNPCKPQKLIPDNK